MKPLNQTVETVESTVWAGGVQAEPPVATLKFNKFKGSKNRVSGKLANRIFFENDACKKIVGTTSGVILLMGAWKKQLKRYF